MARHLKVVFLLPLVLAAGCSGAEVTAGPGDGEAAFAGETRPYLSFTEEGFDLGAAMPTAAAFGDGVLIVNAAYSDGKFWTPDGERREDGVAAAVLHPDETMTPVASPPAIGSPRALVRSGDSVLLVAASCSECDAPELEAYRLSTDGSRWESVAIPSEVDVDLTADSVIWPVPGSAAVPVVAVDAVYMRADESGELDVLPVEKVEFGQSRSVCIDDENVMVDVVYTLSGEAPQLDEGGAAGQEDLPSGVEEDHRGVFDGTTTYTDPAVRVLDLAAATPEWTAAPDVPSDVSLQGPQVICSESGLAIVTAEHELAFDGREWIRRDVDLPARVAAALPQVGPSTVNGSGTSFAVPLSADLVLQRTPSGQWLDMDVPAQAVVAFGDAAVAFAGNNRITIIKSPH